MKFPVYSVGAGAIVANAHYPAYKSLGLQIDGVFDIDQDKAQGLAREFDAGPVFPTLEALIQHASLRSPQNQGIYDLAVPGKEVAAILRKIPPHSYALIQKPMGETLAQAEEILEICREKEIHAAVNFQLRWAPNILALKHLLATNEIGEPHDLDIHVNVHTPWALWTFLEEAPRMELVYHSIHYIDCVRHLFGEPQNLFARSVKDYASPKLESSRSLVYLDYGDWKRAIVHTFHSHPAGPKHQSSYLKVEGTHGVARAQLGLNLDYPAGKPDTLEIWSRSNPEWRAHPLEGDWVPNAFQGPMKAMMEWKAGGPPPSTHVEDAVKTMRLVERAYQISDQMASPPGQQEPPTPSF